MRAVAKQQIHKKVKGEKVKGERKQIILIHTYSSIVIAAILYFFYQENFAKIFFYSSLTMNLYLRLLGVNFSAFIVPGENEKDKSKYNILLSIFSGFRTAIIAAIYAIFILKFKFNLYALALGLLLFQVILIGSGIFFNAPYNNRDSR